MSKEIKSTVYSNIATLLPCVIPPATLTEVKMNAMKWIRGIAIGTRKVVNAVAALQFQLLLFLDFTNRNVDTMVVPGLVTLACNFSGDSLLFSIVIQ